MIVQEESFELISQDIIKTHLELTALIQDIQRCTGPLELLNNLNADGREKIAKLRSSIEKLTFLAERERETTRKADLLSHIDNHKRQLTAAMAAFRKENVRSACAIDKQAREELMPASADEQNLLRKRRDKQGAANVSSQITNHLLDVSKYLAETSQRSSETLDTLVTSSDKVSTTKKELEHQQQVIQQSGKLLGKYGRREYTDKVLVILAFIFFNVVVLYILKKRLF